ncbi:MAG: twin-arginine translocation signal domain-containing protein [Bacteroidales bacterium]|jgi:mannonate dehydratase|nr:twin-arginine translocation signal domain-containing protein [Bacteroidales bacterium]NMD02442.1 twin-arginine translocation signal domain-containing protein [Bacteroidales bacterium]OQB59322.1 MAG: Mannonate dehydratase [Bacteroidetes bacterium ADurb.Bin145]HOU02296.1 mannonate dehydratase [Bacteroidales bacterium]HQK68301.1 mannonate dehydratase [Bacteroidales bacterium]
MKDNRRGFIKKSAAAAAAVSVAGLGSCTNTVKSTKSRPYVRDAGIKFTELMSIDSPRVPFCKMLDINYAVSGVIRMQGVSPWDPEAIKATKAAWEKKGIKWLVVEGPPTLGTKTKLGLEGRDEEISNFITFMKNLKQYGDVDIICYNWMPVISWARTNTDYVGRGGALMLEFDYSKMQEAPLTEYGEISKEHLWDTLEYFVKAVMPEAEKIGMRLSMHADDPQVDVIQGISRIMNTVGNYERLLAMYPKRCNSVTLCQANFATMPDLVDIPSLIRKWGTDVISFVHFRNIRDLSGGARPSTHFTETFHDEGDLDMYEAMKAYYDIGFNGPMRPDHVPVLATEIEAGMRGGYTTLGMLYAVGYMRGLAEAVAKEGRKS